MKSKVPKWSLKVKLSFFMIVIAFVPIFLLGNYSDQLTKQMIRTHTIKVETLDLSHKIVFIEDQVRQLEKFSDWLSMDQDIGQLLNRPMYQNRTMDALKADVIWDLNEQFIFNGITQNVLSLFIVGDNGQDIRGGIEAALIPPGIFYKEAWFRDYMEGEKSVHWGYLKANYTSLTTEQWVVPLVRSIHDQGTGESLGYMIFLLSNDFFANMYQDLDSDSQESIYILDENRKVISTNRADQVARETDKQQIFDQVMQHINEGKTQSSFEYEGGGSNQLILYEQGEMGWIYIRCFPQVQLQIQNRIIGGRLMSSVVILLTAIVMMSILVSKTLTRPIEKLIRQIDRISKGDFKKKIDWYGNNELDQLGCSVNRMSDAIDGLMIKHVEEERQKHVLELQMLQSQINPHFLYNTLSSIKTMASLQGAYGIEKMAGNLGSLLRAAVSDTESTITVQEELGILEKYMYIQKIRYKGKVDFEKQIKDEGLLGCEILKFILQPIVENAIFHGVAPKEGRGKILFILERDGQDMKVSIRDNGVGMSAAHIAALEEGRTYTETSPQRKSTGTGIGMKNIQRRVRLVYGEGYGFKIESEVGVFTCITLRLPITYKL